MLSSPPRPLASSISARAAGLELARLGDELRDLVVLDVVREPVGAQHEEVPGRGVSSARSGSTARAHAEGARQHVAVRVLARASSA